MSKSTNTELESVTFNEKIFAAKLSEWSDEFELSLTADQINLLLTDLKLMLEKNRILNLTSIREPYDALVLHILDSLLFLKPLDKLCESKRASTLLDMGTGGGFPGIPLACTRPYEVTLLDSVGKKVAACSEFVDSLGLSNRISCVHSRLEDFAIGNTHSFNFVVARALSSLDVLIEYATPFLSKGGFLICGKGNPSGDELDNAVSTANICGLQLVSRETYELPADYGHREFYIYKLVAASKVKLPRKSGEAKRNPLSNI